MKVSMQYHCIAHMDTDVEVIKGFVYADTKRNIILSC